METQSLVSRARGTSALEWAERHGRLGRRLARTRRGVLPAAQAGAAAGLSWWIAHWLLGAPHPVFAPIVAAIALGFTTGTRGRAAVQTVLGVAVGILVADVVTLVAGSRGAVEVALVIFFGLVAGLFIGESSTFVTQAAVTGLIVTATFGDAPSAAFFPGRLAQALVGAGMALLFSQVLFPVDVVERARAATSSIGEAIAAAVDASVEGSDRLGDRLADLASASRQLDEALDTARAAVRVSARRRSAGTVHRFRRAHGHLTDAAAAAASLGRIAVRDREAAVGLAEPARAVTAIARALPESAQSASQPMPEGERSEPLSTSAARKALAIVAEELGAASDALRG
ncbi:MAG TPA: FUSC family protein [Gaiellaceae bacterium]